MARFGPLVAVACVTLAVALRAQAPPPPATGSGLIVGQVVDAGSGRPIAGAIVGIGGNFSTPDGRPSSSSRVMTTADGRFLFRDLPSGRYGLIASKPGYTDGAYGRRRPGGPSQQLTLAAGERTTDIRIPIWKHGAISGTVVDEAGEPVIGAIVVALSRSVVMGALLLGSGGAALTDDRGMYRLGALLPADYVVAVVSRHMSLPASQRRNTSISIGPSVVPELGVLAMQMSSVSPTFVQVGDALYAVGGGMAVPPPPSGDRMFIYPTTYYPATPSLAQAAMLPVGSGEERGGIDIHLQPVAAARVSGSVTGPAGPIATALRLLPTDARDAGFSVDGPYAVSDPQGVFTFPAVPAGHYSLVARTGTRRGRGDELTPALWANVPVAVGGSDVTGLNVLLQPGFHISGRFEFEGGLERPTPQALQRVPVFIQPAGPGAHASGPTTAARADADGRFTSPALPPDRYFVRITGSPTGWRFKSATHDGRDVADLPLDLRGDTQVVITFSDRWNHLRGTVTSARGLPDPEAIVLVFPTDTQQWAYAATAARRFKSARAGRTGEYAVGSIPEGDYYAVAVPDAGAGDWHNPSVLESLAPLATRITIAEGETRTQDLRTQEIR